MSHCIVLLFEFQFQIEFLNSNLNSNCLNQFQKCKTNPLDPLPFGPAQVSFSSPLFFPSAQQPAHLFPPLSFFFSSAKTGPNLITWPTPPCHLSSSPPRGPRPSGPSSSSRVGHRLSRVQPALAPVAVPLARTPRHAHPAYKRRAKRPPLNLSTRAAASRFVKP